MRTINLLALVAVVSGGCVVVHDNPGGGGGGGGGGPVGPATYRILPGGSTIVAVGQQAGYGITANTGGSYRTVWTGDAAVSGQYTHFTGNIYTPGTFTVFNPGCGGACTLEPGDVIYAPTNVAGGGQQIAFDTTATTGLDGLDFGVSLEPVEFTLYINNGAHPELVFFPSTDAGGQISSPATIPFDLTTN